MGLFRVGPYVLLYTGMSMLIKYSQGCACFIADEAAVRTDVMTRHTCI